MRGTPIHQILVFLLSLTLLTSPLSAQDIIKAHGISTFGDLKYPADFPHLDYVNPDAPRGGEISQWRRGGFDSMHPYSVKGRAGVFANIFFEKLLTGTADEVGAGYGLLAESLEYPEDRSWVIFNMRPEARFSDGSPLTAEDVAFSVELLRTKGLPSFRAVINQEIDGVEILSPHQIKFSFKQGIPTRDLPATVGDIPIFSKANYEARDFDFEDSTMEPLLGSAPYILESLSPGKQIIYRRNPDYWGWHLPINQGRHNFDTIRIEYFADSNAAFEGFKAGVYHFRSESSSQSWAKNYDFPAVQKGWIKKTELPDGNIATGQSFILNLRRPQFQDPLVREALGLMFNFEWSNKALFYGLYARITSFWENSDMAASGKPSPEELALLEPLAEHLPEGVLTGEAVLPPTSSESQLDRRNLRKASQLLDQAGWKVVNGKRTNDKGEILRIEIIEDHPIFERIINPYVDGLNKLGIDAHLSMIDPAQNEKRTREYDFDIVVGHHPMPLTPGAGLQQYFGCETKDESVFNKAGICSPAIDALIDHVAAATDRESLKIAVRALDRVLRAERFWVPQWFNDKHRIAYYDYYEHPDNLPPYALGSLDFWWANQEKYDALKAQGAF